MISSNAQFIYKAEVFVLIIADIMILAALGNIYYDEV